MVENKNRERDLIPNLKEFTAIFKSILNDETYGFILVNERGTIIAWNKFMEIFTSLQYADVIGRKIWDIQYTILDSKTKKPEFKTLLKKQILQILKTGRITPELRSATYNVCDKKGLEKKISQSLLTYKTVQGYGIIGTITDITEKERIYSLFQESEEKYKTIVETSPDGIVITNSEGTIIFANERNARILGYNKAENLVGKNAFQFVHRDELDKAKNYMDEVAQKGSKQGLSYSAIKKDGFLIPIELNVSILKSEKDKSNMFLGITRDVSERKKIEEKLRKSELLYKTIFERSGTAIIVVDQNRVIKQANTIFEKMSGYPREELEGKMKWTDIATEDEIEKTITYLELRRTNPEIAPAIYESKLRTKQGDIRYILVNIATIDMNGDGIASMVDITKRKEVQKALQISENFHRTIFENTGTALVILDHEYCCTKVNSKFEEITGYSKEEIEQKMNFIDLVPEEFKNKIQGYSKLRKINPDIAPPQYESKIITKDGKIKDILANINRIPETDNFIATLADITESKQTENTILEQKEEIELLLNIITHDLKNHQTIIAGYLNLIIKMDPQKTSLDEFRDVLNKAISASAKSDILLNNIGIFKKLKLHYDYEIGKINLLEEIKAAEKTVKEIFPDKQIELNLMEIDENTEIKADSLFEILILNLLTNAVKYDYHDKKIIDITLENNNEAKTVGLDITDYGRGIEPSRRENIFKAYNTFKKTGKGSGLGLTIVKKLVDRYEGQINIESRIKDDYTQGTKVKLVFNRA